MADYDFGGWATRNNLLCADGRTIRKDAFRSQDGQTVPLVYNHNHDNVENVLGHAVLENRDEGVYAYCAFNDSENGKVAKELVKHGDVRSLSIYANKLKQSGGDVLHGIIREVSLVLAGANPGAFIDTVMAHGDDSEDSLVIGYDENIMLYHSEDKTDETKKEDKEVADVNNQNDEKKTKESEKTVQDVIDSMTEEQKNVMYALIGMVADSNEDDEEGDEKMKHNIFDNDEQNNVMQHSEIIQEAISDAKRYGSMKESFLQHAAANNITNLDYVFPEMHELNVPPQWIKEDESWVTDIMSSVKHSPFSRVKTTFAQLSEDEARAKGYIKGNMKKDMALAMLKRSTTPTTVYIKMKIDRDDVVDITDFDIVQWQKAEMRKQLDKELARAFLLGDGRLTSSDDKINEQNIRPVISDDDMFTIKYEVKEGQDYKISGNSYADNDSIAKGVIRAAKKARKDYKGSGNTTFYTTEALLTDLLLIEDQNGRAIYETEEKLATALRCKKIVTIPEMEGEAYKDVYGIIVNMNDYTAGADKGGAVATFDDFDIDYNQMKYLMETRCSGALTVPYSAIVLKKASTTTTNGAEG
jgi:hypothetical protein